MLDLGASVLIGLGVAGCSFSLVIGALGKLVPESWRMLAFGAGTAAGSFGQFLFSPLANPPPPTGAVTPSPGAAASTPPASVLGSAAD
jgi:hypothetical protein